MKLLGKSPNFEKNWLQNFKFCRLWLAMERLRASRKSNTDVLEGWNSSKLRGLTNNVIYGELHGYPYGQPCTDSTKKLYFL